MDLTSFYSTVGAIILLLCVGFIGRKTKIINDGVSKSLSTITIKIAQPCMILNAMINVEYSADKVKSGFMVLGIALLMHILFAVIAHFTVFKYKDLDEQKITEFGMIFSNCAFIGFPIIESILGHEWLFYGGFYIIAYNLFIWTWGIIILARKRDDIKVNIKSMLINYGTVPCVIGVLLFVIHLPLPTFFTSAVSYLGSVCTPLSLLVTGSLIATCTFKEFFADFKPYYASAVKLLIIPSIICVLSYGLHRLIGFDRSFIFFFTVMSALPTAASTTMYAEMYDIAKKKASILMGMTTIIAMATLPLIVTLLDIIFK